MKTARDVVRFYFQRPYVLGLLFAAFILVLLPVSVEAKIFGLGLSLLLSLVASTLDYLRLRAREQRNTGLLSDPSAESRRGRRKMDQGGHNETD